LSLRRHVGSSHRIIVQDCVWYVVPEEEHGNLKLSGLVEYVRMLYCDGRKYMDLMFVDNTTACFSVWRGIQLVLYKSVLSCEPV